MRTDELGCGGCIGVIVAVFMLLNVVGCIIGKIWDGAQEVLAERHAKQEIADAQARERLAQENAERAAADARAAEARRIEADAAERRTREEKARREAAERKAVADRREAVRMDKLRTFAIQDAPGIWRAYQQLEATIAVQNERISDLAGAMREFDKDPETDADYKSICAARDEMLESLKDIRRKLEEAYLASCRFKATLGNREYADLMHKVLEDGMQTADMATRKFEQMKVEK